MTDERCPVCGEPARDGCIHVERLVDAILNAVPDDGEAPPVESGDCRHLIEDRRRGIVCGDCTTLLAPPVEGSDNG